VHVLIACLDPFNASVTGVPNPPLPQIFGGWNFLFIFLCDIRYKIQCANAEKTYALTPTVFVFFDDLSDYRRKTEKMACHHSQLKPQFLLYS